MVPAAEVHAGQTGLLALLQTPFSCRPKPFTDAQCQWGPFPAKSLVALDA